MTSLAIIGAGVAGLAAARLLRQRHPALKITIYEKSAELGGRAATRRREGYTFDHGAQNIKPSPAVEHLLTAELSTVALRRITLPTWIFDGAGTIRAGDPALNAEPTYTYANGLDELGNLLAAGLDVRRETRVERLMRDQRPATNDEEPTPNAQRPTTKDNNRRPTTDDDRRRIPLVGHWSVVNGRSSLVIDPLSIEADAVLLTLPAPQTAAIIAASDAPGDLRDALLDELGKASYRRCLSFALAYDWRIERPFYALVNTDRKHALAWLALEHLKTPERCPPGHSLLLPQMSPQWSIDHWDVSAEEAASLAAEQVSALLGEDLRRPLWCDRQGWRYALPDGSADFATLNGIGARAGLFFAGDYTAERGRIHLAIESGWRAAEEIGRAIS